MTFTIVPSTKTIPSATCGICLEEKTTTDQDNLWGRHVVDKTGTRDHFIHRVCMQTFVKHHLYRSENLKCPLCATTFIFIDGERVNTFNLENLRKTRDIETIKEELRHRTISIRPSPFDMSVSELTHLAQAIVDLSEGNISEEHRDVLLAWAAKFDTPDAVQYFFDQGTISQKQIEQAILTAAQYRDVSMMECLLPKVTISQELLTKMMSSIKKGKNQQVENWLRSQFPFQAHPLACLAWEHRFKAMLLSTAVLNIFLQTKQSAMSTLTNNQARFFLPPK